MSQGTLTELLNYFGELSINYYTNFNKGEDTANNNFANIISATLQKSELLWIMKGINFSPTVEDPVRW